MSAGYMKKHFNASGKPKQRFETQREAEDYRLAQIARGRWRAESTNSYHCNWCGGYHTGRLGKAHRGKGRKIRTRPIWHTQ